MQEYIDCGLRLGWLINPQNRQVEIYRDNQPKEVLENPAKLTVETVLSGFELKMSVVWHR